MTFEGYDDSRTRSLISGKRWTVTYRLTGDEKTARAAAEDICVEQTVEFPVQCLPEGAVPESVLGRIEKFVKEDRAEAEKAGISAAETWIAVISYAVETAGGEAVQFLNVIFGNISIKRNIQLIDIDTKGFFNDMFPGPRFGVDGIRNILGVKERPLVCSAIKPMGLNAQAMGAMAKKFALGGIDIIKDDHGLANQSFAPFEERVKRCADGVNEGNAKAGTKTLYFPHISCGVDRIVERALKAKELGAGGVFVNPGTTGFDALRLVAENTGLPVLGHPSFLGTYAINPFGISGQALFGLLQRLFGADATIYPNYGGRFPLSRECCVGIAAACRRDFDGRKKIFPCPAGGMTLDKIGDMTAAYGKDTLILIGGGLFSAGGDLVGNCKQFVETVASL